MAKQELFGACALAVCGRVHGNEVSGAAAPPEFAAEGFSTVGP